MKIKTVNKLNLPELIQYIWDNDIESTHFLSNEELPNGKNLRVHVNPRDVAGGRCAGVSVESGDFVVHDRYTFTVEVEEDLTEDTVIQGLADVFFDPLVDAPNVEYYTDCIKNIKQDAMETYSLAIYYKDTLVWSRETGIPEEGVIEL